jgi:DNA (cytosine-5)-methyltransferase 1
MNYYNEFDPKAAAWLRELIKNQLIPAGDVDTRSITDVSSSDLNGYAQCHFFAGIGGWSLALRLAGWPEDKPVWTGSCPCQPFSVAGKGRGTDDERHLWPVFRELIRERKPSKVFGEQVASKLGRGWLAGIRLDMEDMGYAVGAADLCAASAGAPHIRQRLYWVANASDERRDREHALLRKETTGRDSRHFLKVAGSGKTCGMGDSNGSASQRFGQVGVSLESEQEAGRPGYANAWSQFEVVGCADGKTRRFEPGSFPLADGLPGRVGLLRGYGNAIVPEVAAEFIKAFQEVAA